MNSLAPASSETLSPATPLPTLARGANAAREFEAQLIGSLLESMEKTFAALPGQGDMTGSDDYNYLGTHALAEGLAARGGFGIAAMINRYFSAHESKG
jgi:Rod binding domain-containing protein